jgi:signal peptidase II
MSVPAPAPAGRRGSGLHVLSVAVAAGVLALDQLTKAWALEALDDRTIHLFWTLQLNLTFNSGMAFGQAEGWGPVIGVVALVVIIALLLSLRRSGSRLSAVAIGMVIGGALGNLADRAFRGGEGFLQGSVVDFIDFQWWPVFNVADIGVVVGGLLLVFDNFRHRDEPATGDPPPAA